MAIGYDAGGGGGASTTNKLAEDTQQGKLQSCPLGSRLAYANDGSGKLVCRNTTTGRESSVPGGTVQSSLQSSGGTIKNSGGSTANRIADTLANTTTSKIAGNLGNAASNGVVGNLTNALGSAMSSAEVEGIYRTGDYLTSSADLFAAQPEAMLADVLEGQYGNSNKGMGLYGMLSPYGTAANYLFLAATGQDADDGTKQDFINWLENDYWKLLMTPGAEFDVNAMMRNILNPAQNSPLAKFLSVGDAIQQSQNFENLATSIYSMGYHPLIAQAMSNGLEYNQDAFIGESARGATDPFYDWIQTQDPYLVSRGY